MKNLKKILYTAFISLGIFAFNKIDAQNISGHYFGQNAWMPDTIGTTVLNGKLHQNWGNIKDSKASIIRFGGIAPDRDRPTNYQYIKMIDAIRSNGMEPVMQVPFYNNRYSAQQAADIVRYVNITMGKNVKYWVIGNEPDLSYGFSNASQVAAYFKPFASAMKAVDPGILTVGPECAWFNQNIINGLTTPGGPDDITGKDAAGRYYLDIISFHCYPFNGSQARPDVITKLTSAGGLQDNLIYLKGRVNNCNTAHNRTGLNALKTAITEANINWQNSPGDNLNGVGANSFVGAQLVGEMLGIGMKHGVDFINMWSVVEGNNTELNIGYIDAVSGNKKPAYHHFKMMAEHFNGTYVNGTSNQPNVKTFGSKNNQNTSVLIMNQDQATNYNFTVRLNSGGVTGANALKININADIAHEFSGTIQNQSSMLLVFNNQGALIKKVEYTIANAAANQPPTVTNLQGNIATSADGGEETPSDAAFVDLKGFNVNLFPNPANSKFTIELDRKNPQQEKFEIEIFDIMGRLVYTKGTTFLESKQEIDLTGNTMAEAVYIVRVHEKRDKDNTRSTKIILFK